MLPEEYIAPLLIAAPFLGLAIVWLVWETREQVKLARKGRDYA